MSNYTKFRRIFWMKIPLLLGVIFFVLWAIPVFSQIDTSWVKSYKLPENSTDVSLEAVTDGFSNLYLTRHNYGSSTSNDNATMESWQSACTPGDFDNNGVVNLNDVVFIINYLFSCGSSPPCQPVEANGNCELDWGDAEYLINYLFFYGPAPVAWCSNPDTYSDPGYPDTIRIGTISDTAGSIVNVPVYINNDEAIQPVIPLKIDTTKVVCDTVITAGTRGAGIIKGIPKYCKDFTGILLQPYNNTLLPSGSGIVAYLRCRIKSGAPYSFVKIDSTFLNPNKLRFFKENTFSIKPIFISGGINIFAHDDFFVYANFDASNTGGVYRPGQGCGAYKIDDSTGNIYVARSGYCDIYKVSIPSGSDPNRHPFNPNNSGPIIPRTLSLVKTYNFSADCGWFGDHHAEFYVDDNYIYYGPDNYGIGGIERWAKNPDGTFGTYLGRLPIPVPPVNGETFGRDAANDIWYTCSRERTVYSFEVGKDSVWQSEFTYPTYGGDHHDGMEYVGGYLWISDMTSDTIGQWQYTDTGQYNGWTEVYRFSYTNPVDDEVEGMGFGPFSHLWVTGWNRLYELGGGPLQCWIAGIKDLWVVSGDTFPAFDLDDYIPPDCQFTWSHEGGVNITVTIDDSNVVTAIYRNGWTGSEVITFIGTLPDMQKRRVDVTFTVIQKLSCEKSFSDSGLVLCPLGDIPFNIFLRDDFGIPVMGYSNVWLDFSGCSGITPCTTQTKWPIVYPAAPSDSSGKVTFYVSAGGCDQSCLITVKASCGTIASVSVRTVDNSGNLYVSYNDFNSSYGLCRDYNWDDTVDYEDLEFFNEHKRHDCIIDPCRFFRKYLVIDPDTNLPTGKKTKVTLFVQNNSTTDCSIDSIKLYYSGFGALDTLKQFAFIMVGFNLSPGDSLSLGADYLWHDTSAAVFYARIYTDCCSPYIQVERNINRVRQCPPSAMDFKFGWNVGFSPVYTDTLPFMPSGWSYSINYPVLPDSGVIIRTSNLSPLGTKGSLSLAAYTDPGRTNFVAERTFEVFVTMRSGDANGDCKVTVSDVVYIINYLFKGGPAPKPLKVADTNCDGKVTVSDVVYLINYLFKGGPPSPCSE